MVRSSSPVIIPAAPCLMRSLNTVDVSVSAGSNITDVGASMNVTGHLIPRIDIGLSALGGTLSTTVFLNLDASAGLNVSVNADGSDNTATSVEGTKACVDANTGLAVNIGAQAAFLDLFNASTGETLFNKSFPLLQVRHASRGFLSHPRVARR